MALIGLLLLIGGTTQSRFIVYRWLVARSRLTWGEGVAVHRFYQLVGLILMVLGVLWMTGWIWRA